MGVNIRRRGKGREGDAAPEPGEEGWPDGWMVPLEFHSMKVR